MSATSTSEQYVPNVGMSPVADKQAKLDWILIVGVINFLLMALVFIFLISLNKSDIDFLSGFEDLRAYVPYGLVEQGYSRKYVDPSNEIYLRFLLLFLTLCELFLLFLVRLIPKENLGIYLVWPLGAFLATRAKIEFFVFPFTLISLDLKWWQELLVITLLISFFMYTSERNILLVVAFRVTYLLVKNYGTLKFWGFVLLFVVFLLDYGFNLFAPYVPLFRGFVWTRDVANPEYSIIESIMVFLSSYHLAISPPIAWPMHLAVGLLVLVLVVRDRFALCDKRAMLAFAIVFFAATSLTHAFQKAGYYFFYLVPFFAPYLVNRFFLLLTLGWFHILLTIGYHAAIFPGLR